ncbi:hypothetical protein LAZ67_22000549 [Cordylochernes scorpioides]|uniref:Uncharacterized protein n=1 Tax=Cordylochernes scorpioides TaxID=51811 RepID=A0ABY6LNJ2_9ARAC|nr:hypothetical protein LAZ67_22000549 [Cordylochernes scorpioides]
MEGKILVGLSSVQQADKDGLEIEDVLLRETSLKKRAERIVIGNVPFFVENVDLVAALRPYGQITSIVQKMMELGESYWADVRVEAFITLRDGMKLFQIPARLGIKFKGVTSHAKCLQQLQTIAVAAVHEDSWVLSSLNISEESATDITSGSIEDLTELLDQADLSACSTPRTFLQRSPVAEGVLTPIVDRVAALIDPTLRAIADMTPRELWRSWSHIKADLIADINSLDAPRITAGDYVTRAGRFLEARLESTSVNADYLSLHDDA